MDIIGGALRVGQLPCSGGPLCWNFVGGGAGRETGVHPGQAPWCDTVLIPVSRHLSSGTVPRHWVVLLLWWQLQLLYYNYIHTLELVHIP
jgi:hypothetical protein